MKLQLKKDLTGSILDLGGGGEGVIGRLYGRQVIAIDNRQEELDEAPAGFTKLCMDARALSFPDESFDCVTAFYFFMYLETAGHSAALREAHRVLKKGGSLHIWDAVIDKANPFLADLDIDAGGQRVTATYGIIKNDPRQSAGHFRSLCHALGFTLQCSREESGHFYLVFQK